MKCRRHFFMPGKECFLVNYADDFVAGFQYKSEAEMYYAKLKERMAYFNLELEDSKSRLIEFGRFAEQNRKANRVCLCYKNAINGKKIR